MTIDELESRSRSRSSSARTVHRAGGSVRRSATKDDGGPLLWVTVLVLFGVCLIMAIACVRRDAATRAEWTR